MMVINEYNQSLAPARQDICIKLYAEISKGLSRAESKVWHGHPVWFIEGNPIVGYADRKDSVQLLFWSGQSFDEPELKVEGSFKAAQIRYSTPDEIDIARLHGWLKKAEEIQWDYKNIVKRRGELILLSGGSDSES